MQERPTFGLMMPGTDEWWRSVRWVLLVFTFMIALTLTGSFVSYERVVSSGHPWLPRHYCSGCLFCGMTRSFCAMSNGDFARAREWNKGGPTLYTFFWLWLMAALAYSVSAGRALITTTLKRSNTYAMKKCRSNNAWARAGVSALVLLMCSCGGRESSVIRLVPAKSCAIMTIDWSSIRANRELRRLINGDQFETILQRLGVNSETVKSVTVFSSMDAQTLSGLLLSGPFHRDEITSQLKVHGWNEASLQHNRVYVQASDYVAFPTSNILFAGTREGASAVFRTANNVEESILTSDAYKKINSALSLKGRPVKAFLLIPQGTLDMADAALTATSVALSLFNLGGVGQLLKAVNVARGFALTVDSGTQEKYPVELCVLMRDEDTAALVSGSLNAMKTISEMTSSDNREQESLRALRRMTIVRKKEVLAVKMEVPGTALFPPSSR